MSTLQALTEYYVYTPSIISLSPSSSIRRILPNPADSIHSRTSLNVYTPDWHKIKPPCGLFADLLRCRHLMYYWTHCGSGASQDDKNPHKSIFILCQSGV